MNGYKEDRRVRRTKKLLKQGLSELMKEKEFKDISVKDVTERMDLNRGTFYLHYTDIYDLLNKIEEDVLSDFQHMIDIHRFDTTTKSIMPVIEPLVEYINENADICSVLLLNKAASDFSIKIKNLIILNGKSLLERNFDVKTSDEVLNYTLNYIAYGIIGIFKEWMSDFDSIGKKDIIKLSDNIIYATLKSLI
ncbi:MAG: TetR/AcrR family transcriptional regulator [Firmicutes bacterium]|nr:TetR/AcrR family transcriptional regulator [Bacillota bacterium]